MPQGSLTAAAAVVLLTATTVRAEPSPEPSKQEVRACMAVYQSAEANEEGGHLVEASQLFLSCAKSACGDFLWRECTTRNTRLYTEIPTIIPVVNDEKGQAEVDVQVKMDGEQILSRLDGRALPIDPGTHEFSFSTDGRVFANATLTILQGQRNKVVAVSKQPAPKKDRKGLAASEKSSPPAAQK